MSEILYTGAFRFPDGDAAALRVYSIAKLFEGCGAIVSFAGWEGDVKHNYEYQGHRCYSQAEFRIGQKNFISRAFGFLFRGYKTIGWLACNKKYDLVVLYNPPALFALCAITLSKLQGFKIVLDSTEWYESEHLPGGRFGFVAFENWIRMWLVYPLFSNVICISGFLSNHFHSSRNSVCIPPIVLDFVPASDLFTPTSTALKFIYAGDMGLKDELVKFVKAINNLEILLSKQIELHVAGADAEVFYSVLEQAGVDMVYCWPKIFCYGRVSRDHVFELYNQCNFSIFFRQYRRYALAGFPTKAVESLSRGCPVVTNAVGDLSFILNNGVDSYLIGKEVTVNGLENAFSKFNSDKYLAMRSSALKLYFDRFTVEANFNKFKDFYFRLGLSANGGKSV